MLRYGSFVLILIKKSFIVYNTFKEFIHSYMGTQERIQYLDNIFYRLWLIEAYGTGIFKRNESFLSKKRKAKNCGIIKIHRKIVKFMPP